MAKKVATEDLYIGSIIVHFAGTELEVSKEDEEKYGWTDYLASPGSKAAQGAQAAPTPDRATGANVTSK